MQVESGVMHQLFLLFFLSPSTARVRPNSNYKVVYAHLSWSLQCRHTGHNSVSNHQPHDCFLNRSFRHRSKKTSKLRVTGLCAGNSPEAGEFPAHMASNAENVSIWWRHHEYPWAVEVEFTQIWLKQKIWQITYLYRTWWRHQMETFSALLAICAGNSTVPVNSPRKGQWRRALMFSLIYARINGWVNTDEAVIWDAISLIMTSFLYLSQYSMS